MSIQVSEFIAEQQETLRREAERRSRRRELAWYLFKVNSDFASDAEWAGHVVSQGQGEMTKRLLVVMQKSLDASIRRMTITLELEIRERAQGEKK